MLVMLLKFYVDVVFHLYSWFTKLIKQCLPEFKAVFTSIYITRPRQYQMHPAFFTELCNQNLFIQIKT